MWACEEGIFSLKGSLPMSKAMGETMALNKQEVKGNLMKQCKQAMAFRGALSRPQ
jgi:hypothetical protein